MKHLSKRSRTALVALSLVTAVVSFGGAANSASTSDESAGQVTSTQLTSWTDGGSTQPQFRSGIRW